MAFSRSLICYWILAILSSISVEKILFVEKRERQMMNKNSKIFLKIEFTD
jgi:hypothetical protein